MSESVNKTLTDIQKIFKEIVWDIGIKWFKATARTTLPFLNWPILSTVFESLVNKGSEWLFDKIIVSIDVSYIRFIDPIHRAAFDEAQLKLKLIAHTKGVESEEFKKARDEAKSRLSTFIRTA